tara:strand:- start:135 stop:593 length:459 start_codon:yes stop_codon:yes gene_type:complete
MKKKIIESPHDFKNLIGKELGKSSWKLIDQLTIDQFAKSTGDYQWIHVDLEKAKKESPYKNTIAHGYLSLSLIPQFVNEIWECKKIKLILNYGSEKIRFISPVITGNYIRANISVLDAKDYKGGILLTSKINIEIKDHNKIALAAETLSMLY